MSDNSTIEWTDATWNPVTGCTKVSPGCDHCYAETFAERFRGVPGHHFENGFDLTLRPERLEQPMSWKKPRRIFVNSMSDLFHDGIPDAYIARVFDTMQNAPQHTFQVLTKRHARMRSFVRRYLSGEFATKPLDVAPLAATIEQPPRNIWLGVSVENQQWADIRIPALLDTPAAVRWISAEPLLGPVDLRLLAEVEGCTCCGYADMHEVHCGLEPGPHFGIKWVVVGGESGRGARPIDPDWVRSLQAQSKLAGAAFLFKQWGGVNKKATGRELDGRTWDEYPA